MMHVVILCNGKEPELNRIASAIERADLFIAADGGANQARNLDLQPDFIIGDMDSYLDRIPDLTASGDAPLVIENRDQETNDLEKALELSLQKGASEITIFGATGKRLDHTLKNLSVLKRYNSQFSAIRFKDDYGELFLLPPIFKANFPAGTTLSLYPLSGLVEGVTTTGLKYPLNNEVLEIGVRDGTSNITVSEEIVISHKKGDLLLMIPNNTT